jgi:hypothetical protein
MRRSRSGMHRTLVFQVRPAPVSVGLVRPARAGRPPDLRPMSMAAAIEKREGPNER